jgi:F-type H+-transporting ATPase subunit epsilon
VARTFKLLLVTPGRTVYDADAESAVIPAARGMMGILAGHAPFLGSLLTGTISIRPASGVPGPSPLSVTVSGGTVEVLADKVTILADSAEPLPSSPSPGP